MLGVRSDYNRHKGTYGGDEIVLKRDSGDSSTTVLCTKKSLTYTLTMVNCMTCELYFIKTVKYGRKR